MTSFMRHIAGKVLVVWLLSWMLAVLQPCCEAIASTLPHEHAQAQDVHAGDHADGADAAADHQHCEPEIADVSDLSAPVSEKLQANHPQPKPDKAAVWLLFPDELTASVARALPVFHHPPPGRHARVYLQTQRLRV